MKKIAQENGLPIADAFKVHRNTVTLEHAVEERRLKNERKAKALEICSQHPQIGFSLACYLIKMGMSPDSHFAQQEESKKRLWTRELAKRKKMEEDQSQAKAFETLSSLIDNMTPLELAKYGLKYQTIVLSEFTPYDFYFLAHERIEKIHRLELKYFYMQIHAEIIRKLVTFDAKTREKKLRPSNSKQKRYQFPEGMLQEGNEIMLILQEGEIIRGIIEWFTPYDIFLKVGNQNVWVFRHAVVECALMRRKIVKKS